MSSTERPASHPPGSDGPPGKPSPATSPVETAGAAGGAEAPAPEPGAAGVAAPDTSSQPQARPKTKGVADVVFLIDVSGSMKPCIDALRTNIEGFINSLSKGEANNAPPVRDWRGKAVGYRDVEAARVGRASMDCRQPVRT